MVLSIVVSPDLLDSSSDSKGSVFVAGDLRALDAGTGSIVPDARSGVSTGDSALFGADSGATTGGINSTDARAAVAPINQITGEKVATSTQPLTETLLTTETRPVVSDSHILLFLVLAAAALIL
jgi:hypothetical protein